MVDFIDRHKHEFGIEPICAELPMLPSCDHDNKTRSPSKRQTEDNQLLPEVERVFAENYGVYGRRKVWVQLNREGIAIVRTPDEASRPGRNGAGPESPDHTAGPESASST